MSRDGYARARGLADKVYELKQVQVTFDVPPDTSEADRRAADAVQKVKAVLEGATEEALPRLRANAMVMASALRKLKYFAEADQIEALAAPVSPD